MLLPLKEKMEAKVTRACEWLAAGVGAASLCDAGGRGAVLVSLLFLSQTSLAATDPSFPLPRASVCEKLNLGQFTFFGGEVVEIRLLF